ncbi:MAG: PTS glucose transporter subunit IIA, partial [Selenomonadaceae bacterium]|nr:PTS glucose transporter subunit IIA [Selenomonadaceae bacterium]
ANETVCAPVSGKITMLMDESKHAVGMTLSNGAEILIHVGIDTVSMGGEGFEYLVKTGDVVKAGTPLLKFSKAAIKKAGHPDTAIFVITNPNGVSFKFNTGMQGKTNETIIASY